MLIRHKFRNQLETPKQEEYIYIYKSYIFKVVFDFLILNIYIQPRI